MMSIDGKYVTPSSSEMHCYPLSHWSELSRFVLGDERDPKGSFYLAEDVWDALPYTAHRIPSRAGKFRFRFGHLRSFLKPYVKWHCYQRLLANDGKLSTALVRFPRDIARADIYLAEHHYGSPDDITPESSFRALWHAQLLPRKSLDASGAVAMVRIQNVTHAFWKHLQRWFGFPQVVPPVEPYEKRTPTESAFDESQVIPLAVINQLTNKLALHREGRELLNRFDHLRLCVLMLTLALGRRINEIIMAPRGIGPTGPLAYYPAKGSGPKGALWFQFSPNKGGPQDHVYVSSKWETLVEYCVRELIRYSDEIRDAAAPEIRGFLILTSPWNLTGGSPASQCPPPTNTSDLYRSQKALAARSEMQKNVNALSYGAFRLWLSGYVDSRKTRILGALERWRITIDGSEKSEIYRLRTHQARHTRQSAIASDPRVPPFSRQRDLNHTDRNMQTHYQHSARKQNEILLEKAKDGQLIGPAMEWFSALFGADYQGSEREARFKPGHPQPLPPRWRNLIQHNPQFMQFNRVPCGYCALPQGPGACDEYMNCTNAEEGGCRWFLTDPKDAGMLIQITQTVRKHRQQEQESIKAGREVQAEKYHALASRSASLEKEALSHCDIDALPNCSQDVKERLKARKFEIEEEAQAEEHTTPACQTAPLEKDTHEYRARETLSTSNQSIKDHLKMRVQEMKEKDL